MDDQIPPEATYDSSLESNTASKLMDVNFDPTNRTYLIPLTEKLIDTMDWPEGTVVKWFVEGDKLVLKKIS